ncbi:group XIIB secretory phospholipase A2-like protein isoform X1 [Etheostoma spectabile]|uniref:group XIIB secretory phospholipase A2-like protein isoform X1 n=1 Tax=Etheostoma spectabile TaxID=54343 RepID=UPI0013AEFF00|nr:group XIIB secretory phospholipase A2-like protein isoform X1 [Etheostoma spectabile]
MLLRTAVLLLLCVCTGMCATLGHYQTQAKEEEDVPAVTDGVLAAAFVDAAEEAGAPADKQVNDLPAVEEPAVNSIFGDNLLSKILAAADKPVVDVPVADIATAKEPQTDSDRPAGDASVVEALTGEAVTQEQPSSEAEENDIRPAATNRSLNEPLAHKDDNSWSINSIRNSFQSVHGYFDSLVELVGGHNGVCQYRCRYGKLPQPRPGYQLPEPNGCSSSLVGFQVNAALDLGIPAITECCNQHDMCYDTCGTSKYDCDSEFRLCVHGICSDLKKSLGFVSKVQACDSMADALHSAVGTLGCRPYMNSQRAACVCEGEERDEL